MLPSSVQTKDRSFFLERRAQDSDREEVLKQSHRLYAGEGLCSDSHSCRGLCGQIFTLDFDQKDCQKLPAPQVHQFQDLSRHIIDGKWDSLQGINIFDLKVFLNFSPEPLYRSIGTLGPFFEKQFFVFLATDWRFAQVFREEDWDFLFLEIFLNEGGFSPINLLKEDIIENKTFVGLAWQKQNDPALLWIDDYFTKSQCRDLKGKDAENCGLAQYCLLSESLQSDVLNEMMSFKSLQSRLKKRPDMPQTDLKLFCSAFCSSEKGQNYCQ